MTGHLFANDCQARLEVDFYQLNNGIDEVNSDLAKLNDFIKRRGMKLNALKSKVKFTGSKFHTWFGLVDKKTLVLFLSKILHSKKMESSNIRKRVTC